MGFKSKQDELRQQCQQKWDADASLRQEFSSFDAYLSFAAADALGRVRIQGRKNA